MSACTVRPAGPADALRLAELIEAVEAYYGTSEVSPLSARVADVERHVLAPGAAASVLVADVDGTVVGFASYSMLWPAAEAAASAFLKEVFVEEAHRGLGIGRALFGAVSSDAQRRGATRLDWTVDASNPSAAAFYEALGSSVAEGKVYYRRSLG